MAFESQGVTVFDLFKRFAASLRGRPRGGSPAGGAAGAAAATASAAASTPHALSPEDAPAPGKPDPAPNGNQAKIAGGLAPLLGKRLDHVVVAEHRPDFFRIFLVFSGGTYYELYGEGWASGRREADKGKLADLLLKLSRDQGDVTITSRLER